jgi:hypothetical protein
MKILINREYIDLSLIKSIGILEKGILIGMLGYELVL